MKKTLAKYWYGHIIVLLAIIVLVNFGLWQLRRLEQRRALNREIVAGLNQPPAEITEEPVNPDELHRRRAFVTGTFDNENSVVLRGRSYGGQQGVEMVTPLLIAGSDQSVLVNRGWIPLAESDREARRIYDASDEVTIEGIAYRAQIRPDSYFAPTDPTPGPDQSRLDVWFRVDIPRIQQQVDYPLLPIFVAQAPDPNSAETPPIPQEIPEPNEGSHLGYAIQWFTFAVILVGTYASFLWQDVKRNQQQEILNG